MRISGIIMAVVAAMATALLGSCSSDEPSFDTRNPLLPDPDYDSRAFAEMVIPTSDITLTRSEIKSYRKDDLTGDDWEEYDYMDYVGGSIPGPDLIVVKEGKMYTRINRWSSAYGPTRFSTALGLLIKTKVVDRDSEILISRDYDLGENFITVSGTKLNIKNIKNGKMWLTTVEEYSGGRTHNGGQNLYVMTYKMGGSFKDKCCRFDSIEDAYAWVIEAFRARFGEEVNLNNYTDGHATLDNPTFTAAMIEEELQKYRDGVLHIRL